MPRRTTVAVVVAGAGLAFAGGADADHSFRFVAEDGTVVDQGGGSCHAPPA